MATPCVFIASDPDPPISFSGKIPAPDAEVRLAENARIDRQTATATLRADYPHVGLMDVRERKLYAARRPTEGEPPAIRRGHASLLVGGSDQVGVSEKDRFLCYWFYTPRTGQGLLQGYPIEWDEGHLMVRLDPYWDYRNQRLLRSTDFRHVEKNIEQQFAWGWLIFDSYRKLRRGFPLSWHLVGPRPSDSTFYVARAEKD